MDPMQNIHDKLALKNFELNKVYFSFEEQSMDWTSLTTSLSSCTSKKFKKKLQMFE